MYFIAYPYKLIKGNKKGTPQRKKKTKIRNTRRRKRRNKSRSIKKYTVCQSRMLLQDVFRALSP